MGTGKRAFMNKDKEQKEIVNKRKEITYLISKGVF